MTNIKIEKIMDLSKLDIEADKIDKLKNDIELTMNMIDSIREINCSNIKPLSSVCSEMKLVMRNDETNNENNKNVLFNNLTDEYLEKAKNVGHFIVPKVVKND